MSNIYMQLLWHGEFDKMYDITLVLNFSVHLND